MPILSEAIEIITPTSNYMYSSNTSPRWAIIIKKIGNLPFYQLKKDKKVYHSKSLLAVIAFVSSNHFTYPHPSKTIIHTKLSA